MDMHLSNQTLVIPARYCGPPGTANGGYVAGMLAAYIDGVTEVSLWKPTPLDTPLNIIFDSDGTVRLQQEEEIILTARAMDFELDVPAAPTYAQAEAASKHFSGFEHHPYPCCFVCGTERHPTDGGLCIYPGAIMGKNYITSPWTPDAAMADSSGNIAPEFIWAAVDCPGGISAAGPGFNPILMGRYSVKLIAPVKAGCRYIASGWEISREGRKHQVGSALYTAEGEICAYGLATMIEPRKQAA